MRLEIRDIESAMVYDIGPDGAVLGRERARTDISLRDESISKRHARIFQQDGTWLLEDLNSSNGTYVDDQRITAPIRLSQGRLFSLAQRKFEVVYLEGAGAPAPAPVSDFGPSPGLAPYDETGAQPPSMAPLDEAAFQPSIDDEGAESKGPAHFFIALTQSIGFYLVQVPLMALNPVGRINRSFHEQPVVPLTGFEVAGYAVPAAFIISLLGALFGIIAGAIRGAVDVAILIAALPIAGISAVIAAVFGLLAHPILKFLINLFGGESTPRSRTNYIVHSYVLSLVAAIPTNLGVLLVAVPVPYIGLLAPLLSLLVSAVWLYFVAQWLRTFDVSKVLQYLVLALGAVGVIVTALGFVNGVIDAIDGVDAPAAAAGLTPGEAKALADNPQAKAKLLAAKAAQSKKGDARIAEVLAESAQKQRELGPKKSADKRPATENGQPPPPPKAAPPPAPIGPISEEKYPLGITPFVEFLKKRDAIERAIDADPSLIDKPGVRRDYERIWKITYEVREKYYRKKGPRWRKDKIYNRQRGEEVFKRTRKLVDRVYAKLF